MNATDSIVFSDNTNAGTANVTASYGGDSNHTGTTGSTTFTINKATSTVTVTCPTGPYTYTGSALTPACTATATGAGSLGECHRLHRVQRQHQRRNRQRHRQLRRRQQPHRHHRVHHVHHQQGDLHGHRDLPRRPYTYTGSALTPACTATATGAGSLSVNATDSIVFSDNTNAGTANVSASYGGDSNHTGTTGSTTFTINKATSTVTVTCPAGPYTYTGSALTPACTATATGAGNLSVNATNSIVFSDNVKVGTATATASYGGDTNHLSSTGSTTFQVSGWALGGFYQPVDMNGVYNSVKGGSTVPLKFEAFAGTTELTNSNVVKSFAQTKIACNNTSPTDEIEVVSTGGTSLRYDSTGGQFIQNWKTPTGAGTCYRVTMTTQDDSSLVAFFKLK